VVDKGLKEKDIAWGKFDTLIGARFHGAGGGLHRRRHRHSAERPGHQRTPPRLRPKLMETHHYAGVLMASACSTPACSARFASRFAQHRGRSAKCSAGRTRSNKIREAPLFYVSYFFALITAVFGWS